MADVPLAEGHLPWRMALLLAESDDVQELGFPLAAGAGTVLSLRKPRVLLSRPVSSEAPGRSCPTDWATLCGSPGLRGSLLLGALPVSLTTWLPAPPAPSQPRRQAGSARGPALRCCLGWHLGKPGPKDSPHCHLLATSAPCGPMPKALKTTDNVFCQFSGSRSAAINRLEINENLRGVVAVWSRRGSWGLWSCAYVECPPLRFLAYQDCLRTRAACE